MVALAACALILAVAAQAQESLTTPSGNVALSSDISTQLGVSTTVSEIVGHLDNNAYSEAQSAYVNNEFLKVRHDLCSR